MKITGFVETYLTGKKGVKRKVGEQHNTISAELYAVLAQYMTSHVANDLIEMSNMFTGGTGYTYSQLNADGIACGLVGLGGKQAAFASVASQPAANQFRVTGTWTNPEASTLTLKEATLGVEIIKEEGWATVTDNMRWNYPNGGFELAYGGMADTAVPSGELITIVWTITFTVH